MSPDRDDYEDEERDEEEYEEEPRSIFAATWFRALLAVIILAVVAVLALPYVLEWLQPAPRPPVAVVKPAPPPPPKAPAPPAPPPAAAPAQPVAKAPAPPPPPPREARETPKAPAPKSAPPPAQVAQKPRAPEPPAAAPMPKPKAKRPPQPARGDYWVQVGAFTDAKNAGALAARLGSEQYAVQRATVRRGATGGGGNEVFVEGAAQSEVYDKVRAKGYRVDAVKGGAAVRPLLPLREAVALSKELAEAGMKVKIRRVGGPGEQATFHLVRVGGFPDRKQAAAVQKELADKGIPGFIVKGPPR